MIDLLLWLARFVLLFFLYRFLYRVAAAILADVKGEPNAPVPAVPANTARGSGFWNRMLRKAPNDLPDKQPSQAAPIGVTVRLVKHPPDLPVTLGRSFLGSSGPEERVFEIGQSHVFKLPVSFGRLDDNEIVLKDRYASAHHARLFEREGRLWVEDLGSTNGTFLRGNRLKSPVPLSNGDLIMVGETSFSVKR